MNNIFPNKTVQVSLVTAGIFFLILLQPAWAEDGARQWRPIYDVIMRWINFGIMAAFLVKVVGPILVKFLSAQQKDIQSQIVKVTEQKEAVEVKVQDAKKSLDDSGKRLEEIKSRIIERGEKHKQEIIDKAIEQSQLMMKHAKDRIDNQIIRARQSIKNEMVDMAIEKAMEQLPALITEEDNRRLVDQYFT